jgi:hypothetical protein
MTQSPVQRSLWVGLGAFLNFVGQSWVGVRQPDSLRAIVAGQKRVSIIIPAILLFILVLIALAPYGVFSAAVLAEIWVLDLLRVAFIALIVSVIGRVTFFNLFGALLSIYWLLEYVNFIFTIAVPAPLITLWGIIVLPLVITFYVIRAVPMFKLHANPTVSFIFSGLLVMCLFTVSRVFTQILN